MGFYVCTGNCLACKRLFTYNPHYVPSLKGEPICKDCIETANQKRKEMGMEPHAIHPKAYEPQEE